MSLSASWLRETLQRFCGRTLLWRNIIQLGLYISIICFYCYKVAHGYCIASTGALMKIYAHFQYSYFTGIDLIHFQRQRISQCWAKSLKSSIRLRAHLQRHLLRTRYANFSLFLLFLMDIIVLHVPCWPYYWESQFWWINKAREGQSENVDIKIRPPSTVTLVIYGQNKIFVTASER